MPKVTFEREQIVAEARPGQTLLEVAEQHGISVFRGMWPELHCRGNSGWCNRCKVWVKPSSPSAINAPSGTEKRPRISRRVTGTMRLACQVRVQGDVIVHTRAGGPPVRADVSWEPTTAPSAWKDRLVAAKAKAAGGAGDDDEVAEAEG